MFQQTLVHTNALAVHFPQEQSISKKVEMNKVHSQDLETNGNFVKVKQNSLHRKMHARLWNTTEIEEDLRPFIPGVVYHLTLNGNLAVLTSMLKTAEFEHEDFG